MYCVILTINIITHQYNPFNEIFKKKYWRYNANLFPETSTNLFKFPLKVGVTDWFPQILMRTGIGF